MNARRRNMTQKSRTHPSIRALIIDMDGVLWRGEQPIGDLPAIFERINRKGYKFILASNNATGTVDQYVDKLGAFGVKIGAGQVINSGQATAQFLRQRFPHGGPVYLIGEQGLVKALAECNFYHSAEESLAVVVSLDRQLTFDKLRRATLLIRGGIPFIGTNPDRTLPSPHGLVPGTGAILAALEAATDVQPTIIGKPAPEMYRVALERLGTPIERTLVIGDRVETDIAGGQALGCPTALVLSGATDHDRARQWKPPPDFVVPDFTSLLSEL
ncbi:MAG TPA: HAD-IIA family hydrolase [Anaerolineales bacterium]|nr:HAD-IIA family hydrolase [Anaerolineales bacterium]